MHEGNAAITKRTTWSIKILLAFLLFLVLLVGAAYYSYVHYFKEKSQLTAVNSKTTKEQEVASLVAHVGRLIELPKNENPTIATVTDISKLKTQTFFQHAKNGDKVLIYAKAQKAILYDPEDNKIVEVGPLNITADTPQPVAGVATKKANVVIYNGTSTVGLAKQAETQIASVSGVSVKGLGDSNGNYDKSLIVALTSGHDDVIKEIAKVLPGEITILPDSEKKPDADVLIILGKDYSEK